ncbi:hypothetical protein ANN_08358 [Periplaneta americana]|uniref:Uncharacterized protein n=1 Tax=Periplaneta americana TaxID=6978 RepID=A0ABQ8T175_PERAM|nr:hypothetical protein ANN_08358 [Periplaneta americana]
MECEENEWNTRRTSEIQEEHGKYEENEVNARKTGEYKKNEIQLERVEYKTNGMRGIRETSEIQLKIRKTRYLQEQKQYRNMALLSDPSLLLGTDVCRSVYRQIGDVARMGESRNAYRVLVRRPEEKRPLGRPRRRWEDNIKMDLREVVYDDRDWINLAQDRDRWRAYLVKIVALNIFVYKVYYFLPESHKQQQQQQQQQQQELHHLP